MAKTAIIMYNSGMGLPRQPFVFFPADIHDHLFIRLFEANIQQIDQSWSYPRIRSSFGRLYVNNRHGAALELPDGSRYPLTPHRVHLIPAWQTFGCVCQGVVEHLYIHFDLVGMPVSVTRHLLPAPTSLDPPPAISAAVDNVRQSIRNAPTPDPATVCDAKALLYLVIARLLRDATADVPVKNLSLLAGHDPITPALRHIERRYQDALSVPELARMCHLSEDHFIRRFRQQVGRTPMQYLAERRVTAAGQLLLFTRESIDQIATRTGFSDRFYFSRVFKRHLGMGPATYRKATVYDAVSLPLVRKRRAD